ncbi:MAG: metallophosphoesterase [Acidobacteria bacterium]|nr:metallophosphoesterase [Acidobacteriota bacterium]
MPLTRRHWLASLAAARPVLAAAPRPKFTFVHVTDLHIQPERRAVEGCRQCFAQINRARPDFVIAGGDLVFDALAVPHQRAKLLFDLYQDTTRRLEAPLHNTLGNHDVFGLYERSGVSPAHPEYGKRMYQDRIGPRYYSFDFRGWHFVVLDSIGFTPGRTYIGYVDEEQLAWLRNDLEKTGKTTPVVAVTHIPLSTGVLQWMMPKHNWQLIVVNNAAEVLELLHQYNLKAVLQGHTHVCETLQYRGCQYITSGSVSGRSWTGPMWGVHPQGFGLLQVDGDSLSWTYHPYGFKAG